MATRSAISTGPVSSPSSICITMTPVSASPAMMARWIGAAPRQRGSSDPCRLKQPRRGDFEHAQRKDQSVGNDDGSIEFESRERRLFRYVLEGTRRPHLDAGGLGERMHRRFHFREPAAFRARRLGVDAGDVVP